MKFKRFHFYTHKRMLDVAALVLSVYGYETIGYQLKVRWVTRDGRDLDAIDTILIKPNQLNNWYEWSI